MIYLSFGLLALGLVLILIEVFIPSMGMIGSLAAISIVTGGVFAYTNDPGGLFVGYLITSVVLIPLSIYAALKILPRTRFGRAVMLGGTTFSGEEAQASEEGLEELLGLAGETLTALRPAGIARFGDRRVDVVTQGELVDDGVAVKVIKVEGNRVVVAALTDSKD